MAVQGSVSVEHASKFPASCRPGDRSERVGLRGHPKLPCSGLKQKVEVGGHDRRYAAAIRKADKRSVDWRRVSGARRIGVVWTYSDSLRRRRRQSRIAAGRAKKLGYPGPDLAVFACAAVEAALQHAEDDIVLTSDETFDFCLLAIGEKRAIRFRRTVRIDRGVSQDHVDGRIEGPIDIENELPEIRQPRRPGYSRAAEEKHVSSGMGQQQTVRNCR